MRYVLFYETADDGLTRADDNMPAHREHYKAFHSAGKLLLIGTFADPQSEGAMGIFTSREAAEEFARNDPFVRNRVVGNWYVREWDEVFSRD